MRCAGREAVTRSPSCPILRQPQEPTSSSSSIRTIRPAGSCRRRRCSAAHTSLLIVDEAFIDLLPRGASLAGNLPANAVVLRSFGKTYGLAGVRLGFAIAPLRFAQHLGKELGPWAVSGPALEIGRVALDDEAWLKAAAKRLAADQEKLDALLLAAGFTILGGTPLFRLGEHPEATRLVDALGRQGIHVRAFADRPTWLRFGLPANEEEFSRLATALSRHPDRS